MLKILAAALLASTAIPAAANIIEIPRSISISSSVTPDSILANPQGISVFTFDVPPPFPGPIFAHGSQHWYSNTRLISLTFSGQQAFDLGPGTFTLDAPRNLGRITTTLSVSQGFLNEDLALRSVFYASFSSINANLIDSYVPEPGTWMMLIAGFGMVGHTMRRRSARLKSV